MHDFSTIVKFVFIFHIEPKIGSVCGLDPKYCDETHIDTSMLSDPGKSVPAWNPEPGKNQTVKINQVRNFLFKNWKTNEHIE